MPQGGGWKERKRLRFSSNGLPLDTTGERRRFFVNPSTACNLQPSETIRRMDMRELVRWLGTGLLLCAMGSAGVLAQGWQHIGKVERVEVFKDGIQDGAELTAGKAKVRITRVSNGIMRVRVAPNGHFPKDFSWALAATPWPETSSPVHIL